MKIALGTCTMKPRWLAGLSVLAILGLAVAAAAQGADGWGPDQRLTFDPAPSLLSFNFARSVAADAFGGVHVVWYDGRDGGPHVYTKRSLDGGSTWGPDTRLSSMPAEHPAIAISGREVFVVWHGVNGSGPDIFLCRSEDGGQTWGDPLPLTESHAAAHASVAASGSHVQVVWGDSRSGHAEIFTRASLDSGESWEDEAQVSPAGFDSWVPTVAVSGTAVHVAWVDTRDGNEEEYYRRSLDGGATWQPVQRLTKNGANSWAPSLAITGNAVHLVWFDQQDSPIQPLDAERKLDDVMHILALAVEPPPSGVMVPHPAEAAKRRTQEKLQLVLAAAPAWVQAGGDAARLQAILHQLDDLGRQGASYFDKERKIDEAVRLLGLTYVPGPMADLPRIYYEDALQLRVEDKLHQIAQAAPGWVTRGGDPAELEARLDDFMRSLEVAFREWEVYYRRSPDGGKTWGPIRRLTRAPDVSQRPSLAADGATLHVVWFDHRDGNFEVYAKQSRDGGRSWGPDLRLTRAAGDSQLPSVAAANGHVYVVWSDLRAGNAEIYFKRR